HGAVPKDSAAGIAARDRPIWHAQAGLGPADEVLCAGAQGVFAATVLPTRARWSVLRDMSQLRPAMHNGTGRFAVLPLRDPLHTQPRGRVPRYWAMLAATEVPIPRAGLLLPMTRDLGRRSFLKGALGAAGVGAGLLHPWLRALASYPPCTPTGAVWGALPAPPMGQQPIWAAPPDLKILEIHLYGGLSPWETFYVRPPTSTDRYRGFNAEVAATPWGTCDTLTDPEPTPFATTS